MDDDRTSVLRHRIETLRRYLAEGVMAEIATLYLQEIARAEAELALIASREPAEIPLKGDGHCHRRRLTYGKAEIWLTSLKRRCRASLELCGGMGRRRSD